MVARINMHIENEMNNKKRKPFDIGSLIGWLIFGLVIAGGPILNAIQSILGGVRLPSFTVPLLIAALVLLSVVVSAVRALTAGRQSTGGDVRLPTEASEMREPINMPMPPFGGEPGMPRMPVRPPRTTTQVPPVRDNGPQYAPRFEPVFSPVVVAIGLFGLLVLGGLAVIVFGGSLP